MRDDRSTKDPGRPRGECQHQYSRSRGKGKRFQRTSSSSRKRVTKVDHRIIEEQDTTINRHLTPHWIDVKIIPNIHHGMNQVKEGTQADNGKNSIKINRAIGGKEKNIQDRERIIIHHYPLTMRKVNLPIQKEVINEEVHQQQGKRSLADISRT